MLVEYWAKSINAFARFRFYHPTLGKMACGLIKIAWYIDKAGRYDPTGTFKFPRYISELIKHLQLICDLTRPYWPLVPYSPPLPPAIRYGRKTIAGIRVRN